MADTQTIDRLFLELSQFTKAKTRREMELEGLALRALGWIKATTDLSVEQQTSIDSLADGGSRLMADLAKALGRPTP